MFGMDHIKTLLIRAFIVLISFLFFISPSISVFANSINCEHEHRSYSPIDIKIAEEINSSTNQNLKGEILAVQFTCKSESSLVAYRNWATHAARKAAKGGMITVGRWMSKAEYEMMAKTGQMVEGAGGQTFVATGGPPLCVVFLMFFDKY